VTEAKHTPGPWQVGEYSDGVGVGAGFRVALMTGGERYRDKANARLIAAAPELLDALQKAVGALEFSRDYHKDLGNEDQAFAQDMLDAALKAIAKATGAA
jgi:hypothetical protein